MLTITVNKRLSRWLVAQEARGTALAGRAVWEPATILPLGAWLRGLYEERVVTGDETRALLTPLGEAALWEEILRDDADGAIAAVAFDVEGTARSVQQAWALLHEYDLDLAALGEHETAEARALRRWCRLFVSRCEAVSVRSRAELPRVIAAAIEGGALSLPEEVTFRGFDEVSPARRRLASALSGRGVQVTEIASDSASEVAPRRVSCGSSEEELHAAAAWARSCLAQRPTSRVALVVPRLAEHRERILAALEDIFEPGSVLPGTRPQGVLYNVSLGQPLAAIPMVYDAILWWRLAAGEALEIDTLSHLLRSPFTGGGQDERVARALVDLTIRDRGRPAMTLASMREFLAHLVDRKNSKASVPVRWSAALDRLGDVAAALAVEHSDAGASSRRAAEAWPEVLRKILAAVGWPGDRSLDSDEHQELDALGGALRDLAGLDLARPEGFDYPEILHWVARTLEETLFQPESRAEAPVQVLGQLEAVGQPFDHAWIVGLDEAHWPVSGEPNSFLPLAIQRAHAMPHASPSVDLARARRLTATLLALADDVVVSSPRREDDLFRVPSPLIAFLPEVAEDELGLGDVVPLVDAFAVGTLESFIDDQGPVFVPSDRVRGGSSLFADQAACPFRAFARHRLVASAPETPEAGVTAATYGSLVHRALEDLFGILKSHADLVARSEAELRVVAQDAAGRAIETWRQRLPDVFSPRLTRLLHGRLSALLSEWLTLERDRLPFRVVARERAADVIVGDLTCRLRVDRVDALDDGSMVILDYKTGQGASHGDWLRDRLGEPQLPLYAAFAEEGTLGGVAFAKVRRDGKRSFDGVVMREGVLPSRGKSILVAGDAGELSLTTWRARWREAIEGLAADFVAGVAAVDPVGPSTCDYCGLDTLCRWHLAGEDRR